jgi:hypothetical protein
MYSKDATNPKTAKSQQEKAKKEAEKRIKNFQVIFYATWDFETL